MSGKRYYWLKLQDDFFDSKRIKKLRNMAGGDTYTIIYLKMQLLAMKHDGIIQWTGLEENIADELALDLDESADDVRVTLTYLLRTGLAETSDNVSFFFPYAVENVGSEGSSAQRMRDMRERTKMLQSDNASVTLCAHSDGEIEREKEIEKEKSKSKKKTLAPSLESSEPAIISLTLNTGEKYPITQEDIENFKKLYPAVDVLQQFRNMCGWLDANPTKRKTRSGIKRFVNTWLAREQNDYHPGKQTQQSRYDAIAAWANERSSE